ncbi:immunoglobulin superfamily member 3-like [Rhinoderma darwinii]|uniref:immunoglobulin superfamily member 3-like n=1 Tax=Rhinoderma darwinii TaxID=43563 RepID=UPI003F6729A4
MERSTDHHHLQLVSPLFTGLLWLSIVGVSWAQREVTIQQGPLYRTVGSHITIWCKVRGYQGPSEQNFQYSIYLPSAPDREVQMVSTQDPSFSYAIYNQRVQIGDISIERVTGDRTTLHIRQLQERDAGEYECHTPNTDPKFYGSYSAKVNLRVLPDTLIVTMPQQEQEKTEGSSLELTCIVSKNSSQHTHLSVSWLLTTDKDIDLLSLSRDFVLVPGVSFSERFSSGDIRMDKLSDSSYRLSIKELQLSDQGDLYCQGSEWIQDPDGIWTMITEKKSQKTKVKISALQGGDFKVQVESTGTSISLSSPLEITCSISGHSPTGGRYRVTWLLDGAVMVTWDSNGASRFGKQYSTQEAKGQMTVRRRDQEAWILRINQASEQDGGSYLCDVTEEGTQRRRQSTSVSVTIQTPRAHVPDVVLRGKVSEVYEGDSVTLFCQVSGSSSFMDVSWLILRTSGSWVEIASLRRDGEVEVAVDYAQTYITGLLTAQRLSNGLHSLKLDSVLERDGGQYGCRLREWTQPTEEEWRNETYNSNRLRMNVLLLGSALEVVLMSRDQQATSGNAVSLFCNVKAAYSLRDKVLSWSWDFQPPSGSSRNLVNVSRDGGLSWGDSIPGFQGLAQVSIMGNTSTLKIYRAQQHHQGAYRCRVRVLRRDPRVPPASASSIIMNVKVQLPAARLLVDTADRVVLVTGGQDEAVVFCDIKVMTPGAVLHVGWFLVSPPSPSAVNILNVTHDGLTSHNPSFSWFLSERISPNKIVLRNLRPRLPGSVYCAVRELLQESGGWVVLAEQISGITRVMVSASDKTLKIPKENVSRAALVGGDVVLRCPLEEVHSSAALYSVSWYYQGSPHSSPSLLYRAGWEGVTGFGEALAGRLQVVAAVRGNYSLILRGVGPEDAGVYHCQVEEWRLQEQSWRLEASDTSGYLQLRVTAPGDRLRVNGTELTLVAPEDSSLTFPCGVESISVPGSVFSITWWKVLDLGHHLVFNASHLGQFVFPSEEGSRLQYERPSELTFQLKILRTQLADAGIYYCRIREWVRTPRGVSYQIAEQSGGNISVTIQAAGSRSHSCSSSWLFYFLLLVLLLFFFLLVVFGWRLLTRWRNKTGGSSLRNGEGRWSEMYIQDRREEDPETEAAAV